MIEGRYKGFCKYLYLTFCCVYHNLALANLCIYIFQDINQSRKRSESRILMKHIEGTLMNVKFLAKPLYSNMVSVVMKSSFSSKLIDLFQKFSESIFDLTQRLDKDEERFLHIYDNNSALAILLILKKERIKKLNIIC